MFLLKYVSNIKEDQPLLVVGRYGELIAGLLFTKVAEIKSRASKDESCLTIFRAR